MRKRRFLTILVGLALSCACPSPRPISVAVPRTEVAFPEGWRFAPGAAPATASRAMVVSDAPLATQVGVAVLRAGGNAVDAAVATAFALAVVLPPVGNVGGGGFLVARVDGRMYALDFREVAPQAATRDMFADSDGEQANRGSRLGHRASGVPGSVAGLWAAHQRFGKLRWKELLAPAIRLARDGFLVDEAFVGFVVDEQAELALFPASAALYLPPPRPGSRFRNPDLAATLSRIADKGPDGFYRGPTADLIVAEMQRGGGLITHQDLQSYQPKWRKPLRFRYRGLELYGMPPPSSGGLVLAMCAHILAAYDLSALPWHGAEELHLLAEAMRRAFAARNALLGDPQFVDVPVGELLSKKWTETARKSIDRGRASRSEGVPSGVGDDGFEGIETSHIGVVDERGNAAALTTTLNDRYGSKVTVTGAGFHLNDEMDDFTAQPGRKNKWGLVQGEANAIAPGKRPLSSMSPTIVLRGGRVFLVLGAAGGPRIISAVLQLLSSIVDHGLDPATAVRAPRIHHQHFPDAIGVEDGGLSDEVRAALETMGHTIEPLPKTSSTANVILRDADVWTGAHDPRRGGAAVGY